MVQAVLVQGQVAVEEEEKDYTPTSKRGQELEARRTPAPDMHRHDGVNEADGALDAPHQRLLPPHA